MDMKAMLNRKVSAVTRRILKAAAFAIVGLLGALTPLSAQSGYVFPKTAQAMVVASQAILIRRGLCTDENECNKKEFFLFRRTFFGIELNYYGITDAETIAELTGACVATRQKAADPATFTITLYPTPHRDQQSLSSVFPILTVKLSG